VTGEHIASLNSKGITAITPTASREITLEDVERVVENSRVIVLPPDREIIHAIPRGFIIDGQNGIKHPAGMSGSRLEVETHIVTGAITFLQNIERCVQRAGLAVEETVLEPLAASKAVLSSDDKEIGVALADIGGGTTDVVIFTEGAISYSGIVPIGGQYVTSDINKGLRTTLEEAERLKIEYGSAWLKLIDENEMVSVNQIGSATPRNLPRRVLAEIIEPRMEELLKMVRQHLQKSGSYGLLPAGLVLTGGGSRLRGTVELAQEIIGAMPVRIGVPRNAGGLSDTVANPAYATAVGLVCYGAREGGDRRKTSFDAFLPRLGKRVMQLLSGLRKR
jgi:cell division protein FtsA